jgi:hypothetical protein
VVDERGRSVPRALEEGWQRSTRHPDALVAVTASRALLKQLGSWQGDLVAEALEGGATWEEVGAALGTSRQAAWARFRGALHESDGGSRRMEDITALNRRVTEQIHALETQLKALDGGWQEERRSLRDRLRELDRRRGEERRALHEEIQRLKKDLRREVRTLREAAPTA